MDRFQPISITNSSLGAHLYSNEEVYLLTSSVGLYSGPYKSIPHSSGTVYLTTHRLFYIDDDKPHSYSCFLPLELIRETQYYAGFLKSSPKVTLVFAPEEDHASVERETVRQNSARGSISKDLDWRQGASVQDNGISSTLPSKTWICRICAFSNVIDAAHAGSNDVQVKCQLCGVTTAAKDLVLEASKSSNAQAASSSTKQQSPQKSTAPLQTSSDGISCPVCTFANHPSMSRCEMCNTTLGNIEPQVFLSDTKTQARQSGESLPPSGAQTPVGKESEGIQHSSVRLSFRKSGDKAFYSTLKTTLKDKSWLKIAIADDARDSRRDRFSSTHRNIDGRTASSAFEGENGVTNMGPRRVGIEGIFSTIDLHAREDSEDMRDAFRDLEALMTRAKKMVDFAETLNAKLNRQEAAAKRSNGGVALSKSNDEAANIIRSSLVRLGLPTPAITADMAKDEMEYNVQLAKELAGLLYNGPSPLIGRGRVLSKPLDDLGKAQQASLQSSQINVKGSGRGIIPLDELWCMWNRARGVALISPKTLLDVSQVLPSITSPPITCKTFQSGLRVLHTSRYQMDHFTDRVQGYIEAKRKEGISSDEEIEASKFQVGASTLEIAKAEDCPLHLIGELLNEVEYENGSIVRDEQGEVTWYPNLLIEFDWDHWQAHRDMISA